MALLPLAAASMLAAPRPASAGQSNDPRNAATWYRRAAEQYEAMRLRAEQDLELIWNHTAIGDPITPELRAALARARPILDQAHQGAARQFCDNQLDYSQGVEMLMPHLSQMRHFARLMRADALVRLNDGDGVGAADLMADMYRMSSQFDGDRVIIASLVGQAIFTSADDLVQSAIDRGMLGSQESFALLQGVQRLDAADPFHYVEALATERDMFVDDLARRLTEPEDRAEMLSLTMSDEMDGMALVLMDQAQVEVAIADYSDAMGRAVEIFANPDRASAKQDLAALEGEVEAGMHGCVAKLMMPALHRVFEQRDRSEKLLAERVETLRILAMGEARPEQLTNAALWYIRGIDIMEQAEVEALRTIRSAAHRRSGDAGSFDEATLAALASKPAQDAIDLFRVGAQSMRCDFSFTRSRPVHELVPSYAPGMHDALQLLRADALRLLRADDAVGALDRLVIAARMAAHLGGDPQLVSALIAHRGFNQVIGTLEVASDPLLNVERAGETLTAALELISRRDPFGYLAAAADCRKFLSGRIIGHWAREGDTTAFRAQQARLVRDCDGDQLLCVLAVFDTLVRAAKSHDGSSSAQVNQAPATTPSDGAAGVGGPAAAGIENPLAKLSDLLDAEWLMAIRDLTPLVAPRFASRDFSALAETDYWPRLAARGFVEGSRWAPHDLRHALELIEKRAAPHESPRVSPPKRSREAH